MANKTISFLPVLQLHTPNETMLQTLVQIRHIVYFHTCVLSERNRLQSFSTAAKMTVCDCSW